MFLSFPGLFCRRKPQSSLEFPSPAHLLCFHKTLIVFWKEHFFLCHHQVAFPAGKGKLQPGSCAHCCGGDLSRSATLLLGEGRTQMFPPSPSSHVSVTSDLHETLEVRKYNLRNKFRTTYGCHIVPQSQPCDLIKLISCWPTSKLWVLHRSQHQATKQFKVDKIFEGISWSRKAFWKIMFPLLFEIIFMPVSEFELLNFQQSLGISHAQRECFTLSLAQNVCLQVSWSHLFFIKGSL